MFRSLPITGAVLLCAAAAAAQDTTNFATIGKVHRLDPALDALIPPEAQIEVVAAGFAWSEGPVWVPHTEAPGGGFLLFSDIPPNRIMKWEEGIGASVYLEPAGYTGKADYGGEPGSNGLALDAAGALLLCEHGDRRLARMTGDGGKVTLAAHYDGRRFNSPNDLAIHSSGAIYFTDPIYGLPKKADDPRRELDFCGVYRWHEGEVTLLTKEMTRPNGIAFSPDESILYVANSDPKAAVWKAFPVLEDGTLGESRVFFDASEYAADPELRGLPDGLKVDEAGNLFATGPGGVWVFSPEGKALGRIATGERIANCGWGNDGGTLYMTSDPYLARIRTATKGDRFNPERENNLPR